MTAEHGTATCYRQGCRCEPCRRVNARRTNLLRLRRQAGVEARYDAGPAVAMVRGWRAAGWSSDQIAQATGLTHVGVADLEHNRYGFVTRKTTTRLASVDWSRVTAGRIPILGTARRLQALAAAGWTTADLADRMGVAPNYVAGLRRQDRDEVYVTTRDAVAEIYASLSEGVLPDGPAADRSRRYAARQGWAPPAAWDDIDDPDEQPKGARPPVESRRRDDAAATIAELAQVGQTLPQISTQLGIQPRTIYSHLYRAGLLGLWHQLKEAA